jgi:peptide/nickel transport system permease protein
VIAIRAEEAGRGWRDKLSRAVVVSRLGAFPLVVVLIVVGSALRGHSQDLIDPFNITKPPLLFGGVVAHPLGTDEIGRDMLARLLVGARTSLALSFAGVATGLVVGVPAGFAAALGSRWVVAILVRVMDLQLAFPYILLALFIVALTRPSFGLLVVLLALPAWIYLARVVRSMVLVEKEREYVLAARALGARNWRLATKYILPQLLPVIATAALNLIASLIILEATLDFLGMGIQPPAPSLGSMIFEGLEYQSQAWWISILPGIVVLIIVASLFALVRELHRLFDPRTRNAGRP